MKVFIWKDVKKCSDRYHSGGGVVVIAESEDIARELANKKPGCEIGMKEKADYIVNTDSKEEKVFIFPDAGCC